MKKLIKITDTHYVIVDDSEKGQIGYNYNFGLSKIDNLESNYPKHSIKWNYCRKITHSTQPLEKTEGHWVKGGGLPTFNKINELSISDIEELLYGYNINKILDKEYPLDEDYYYYNGNNTETTTTRYFWSEGFQYAMNLVKNKNFTINDIGYALNQLVKVTNGERDSNITFLDLLNESKQKTEWDIEIVEDKIELI